ncbi:MAG: 2-phospho-L-lactate guanylyltransferase [Acidimicrobiaceae bacterium]|nr:2-phospho-L-lactate guanylyltransferase [Ilumatobacteraceae bacterium]
MRVAVVIPVKSFTLAKGRLSDTLTPAERETLATECATTVLRAASPLPAYVVCSDPVVAEWATSHGAHVVQCLTPGLDVAVAAGRDAAHADGCDHIVVAHADLPLARSFEHVAREGIVTMITDRHSDGTNVLSFPIASDFSTAYGPGSFENHKQIAVNAHLHFEVLHDPDLELDLDTADDLTELHRRTNHER